MAELYRMAELYQMADFRCLKAENNYYSFYLFNSASNFSHLITSIFTSSMQVLKMSEVGGMRIDVIFLFGRYCNSDLLRYRKADIFALYH